MNVIVVDDDAVVAKTATTIRRLLKVNKNDIYAYSFTDADNLLKHKKVEYAFIAAYSNVEVVYEIINKIRIIDKNCFVFLIIDDSSDLSKIIYLNPDIYINRKRLSNLLFVPINNINNYSSNKKLIVKCFGYFDVFDNGIPIVFKRSKAKELLAYLIYKEGKEATIDELCAVLYPNDENDAGHKSTIRVATKNLKDTLNTLGYTDVFIHKKNSYFIKKSQVDCDYYDWLDGKIKRNDKELMVQYSEWSSY